MLLGEDVLTRLCRARVAVFGIADIRDLEQSRTLFDNLCTRKEIDNMAEWILAAKLLMQGNAHSQVMEQADISSATLSGSPGACSTEAATPVC